MRRYFNDRTDLYIAVSILKLTDFNLFSYCVTDVIDINIDVFECCFQ